MKVAVMIRIAIDVGVAALAVGLALWMAWRALT
jgi:hypothetical protein